MKTSSNTKARTTSLKSTLDYIREITGFNKVRNKLLFNFSILLLKVTCRKMLGELKRSILKAFIVNGSNANLSRGTFTGIGKRLSDYRAAESLV